MGLFEIGNDILQPTIFRGYMLVFRGFFLVFQKNGVFPDLSPTQPAQKKQTPLSSQVVLIHGLGVGITPYLRFIRSGLR